ncbi:Hypothetical protein NTJ_02316 [Nesidiocoris tenuis]|uniref:Uncharacterized protein n=1 Tax=Nesidiocoris tenuis TaxID=355587 RepID=A0ABN7ADS6_9HEMI|nr:Hypothetical protein NTJ_02316 [Nesidiocoris tenuis]
MVTIQTPVKLGRLCDTQIVLFSSGSLASSRKRLPPTKTNTNIAFYSKLDDPPQVASSDEQPEGSGVSICKFEEPGPQNNIVPD